MSAMRSFQCPGEFSRMGQHVTEIPPDKIIQLSSRGEARWTMFASHSRRLEFARADVIGMRLIHQGAADASQLAVTATDQSPQQIGMHCIVTASERFVLGQFALHQVELRLRDDGRDHGDGNPFRWWCQSAAVMRSANRVGGGTPDGRRPVTHSSREDLARIDRVSQDSSHGGQPPYRLAGGRGNSALPQNPGHLQ